MAWEIKIKSRSFEYQSGEEVFSNDSVRSIDRKLWKEPSGGYQEPDDDVIQDTYSAESDHGIFQWTVTARREGLNGYAEIESVELIKAPDACELIEYPSFSIVQVGD